MGQGGTGAGGMPPNIGNLLSGLIGGP